MATRISRVRDVGSLSNTEFSSSHGLRGCVVSCGWSQSTLKRLGVSPLIYLRPHGTYRILKKYHVTTHASTQEGGIKQSGTLTRSVFGVLQESLAPMQKFPWHKFSERLIVHASDSFWVTAKWLFVPLLVLSAAVEIILCISNGRELLIPLGLLAGTLVGGSLKETITITESTADIKDEVLPWNILLIGLLFGLIKLTAYKFPMWLYAFFVHFGNAGLWQIIMSAIDWRKRKSARNLEKAL